MILSDISGLGKWSKKEIEVKCDICEIEKSIEFKLYTSYGYIDGEYLCRKCKLKKNNLEKWGVENVFQLESTKEKTKKTNLEKFGVEFISQSNELKVKIKESKSKLDNESINQKRKYTNLEKWGVENVSQSQEVKKSKEKKYIQNWNSNHNKKSERFRKENFKIANDENYLRYLENGTSLFKCDNNILHNFEINIDNYVVRKKHNTVLCTVCSPIGKHQSGQEIKLYNYIKSIYNGEIVQNFKIDRVEIDIYLPELKSGLEMNGIYWHSDKYKDKSFHLNKSNFFEKKGIRLIHIWEDDWKQKNEIIKSQIRSLIGINNKIHARKCKVIEIKDVKLVREFLNNNHIQGYVNSNIKLGLFYNEELVSLMTFDKWEGRKKMSQYEWNLNRFCNKLEHNIIGGASKLLKFFLDNLKPKRIISYADKDWSRGNLYQKLNFEKVSESEPDYKYVVGEKRVHKSNFKKSVTGISESKLEIPKIWDCGKIKWELNL
jgi:hypothetical protein